MKRLSEIASHIFFVQHKNKLYGSDEDDQEEEEADDEESFSINEESASPLLDKVTKIILTNKKRIFQIGPSVPEEIGTKQT